MSARRIPPANTSLEAVALREAAMKFTYSIEEPASADDDDTHMALLNVTLLEAALAYARRVARVTKLTKAQRKTLKWIGEVGRAPDGSSRVAPALERRGLLRNGRITRAGRKALKGDGRS